MEIDKPNVKKADNKQAIYLGKIRTGVLFRRSTIQCHGDQASKKPGVTYGIELGADDFTPFSQRTTNDPKLKELLNILLVGINSKPIPDVQIAEEVERIKKSENFFTDGDLFLSKPRLLRDVLKSSEKHIDIKTIMEKFKSDLDFRKRILETIKLKPEESEIFQNTPGNNVVEKFENYLSRKIERDRANFITQIKEEEVQISKAEKLLRARAIYNIKGDASVFNPYLPTRNFLSTSPEALSEYEALVNVLMKRSVICWGSAERSGRNFSLVPNYKHDADESSRYLICASIAEVFYRRSDLVQLVTGSRKPFEIILLEGLSGTGGVAFQEGNRIAINNRLLMLETAQVGSQEEPFEINPVAHEFLHALDKFSSEGRMDGNIPGLSKNQKRIFEAEKIRLTNIHDNYRIGKTKDELERIERQTYDPATSLPNYTFSGIGHFVVVTSTLFHKNPALLKKVSPKLFDLYCDFYRFNPLHLYSSNK